MWRGKEEFTGYEANEEEIGTGVQERNNFQ